MLGKNRFFKRTPTALGVHLKKFSFSKISCAVEKYLVWQSFRCVSAISAKWDQKAKRGKPKNEKRGQGVGRVLEKYREFFLANHEYNAKNHLEIG